MDSKYQNIGDPLTLLQEECAEVIHIICKIRRFGLNNFHPKDETKKPNHRLLIEEMGDLYCRMKEAGDYIEKEASGA